jgi:long-chain acyl-CoA synthetase
MDAWVVAGPQRAYASAIVIIDYNNVGTWAGQRRVGFSTFSELAQRPEVYELVRQHIALVNGMLSPGTRVRKFVHLHREFDPDEGEMTRTRKLRRAFLEERYRKLLDAIYAGNDQVSIEAQGAYREGRTETVETILRIQPVEGGLA